MFHRLREPIHDCFLKNKCEVHVCQAQRALLPRTTAECQGRQTEPTQGEVQFTRKLGPPFWTSAVTTIRAMVAGRRKGLEILASHVVEEDFFLAIATADDVVNGPTICNAPWAWYGAIVTRLPANFKHNTTPYYGLYLSFRLHSADPNGDYEMGQYRKICDNSK
jgi:hypothetical protein